MLRKSDKIQIQDAARLYGEALTVIYGSEFQVTPVHRDLRMSAVTDWFPAGMTSCQSFMYFRY